MLAGTRDVPKTFDPIMPSKLNNMAFAIMRRMGGGRYSDKYLNALAKCSESIVRASILEACK